jgi:ribosomal protein S18 acetylase RimI-like enzyme
VRVRSLGWRTDLRLRELEGAEVVERQDHLVVRSAANPAYRWGNFLLFASPPRPGDAERWLARFEQDFPEASYVAIGIDSPAGDLGELDELRAAGMTVEIDAVLSADGLRAPAREPPPVEFRRLQSDADWRRATALRYAVEERPEDGYRDYLERQMRTIRRVSEQGHGAWLGAFCDGEMRSSLGIFNAGGGLARFQSVDTHPAHRRQGLATNLLLAAGRYALAELGASKLVIAADPDYHAIDIYRSLGFRERERHVQLERLAVRPRS